MNYRYSIRLLIVIMIGISAGLPSQAAHKDHSQSGFTYQFTADSSRNFQQSNCGSSVCESPMLLAENSKVSRHPSTVSAAANNGGSVQADEESPNSLFGFALGNISSKNLMVAIFCFMSGILFLLFGLKGW